MNNPIDTIASSWCRRNRPESMNTDWGQSLLAMGLLAAVRKTGNADAREYLRRWLTYHLGAGVHVTYFVGSWSLGLLYPDVIEVFPEFEHPLRDTAERIYTMIRHKAIRNGDGVILHNVDLPHIYIDTIYYSAPVLARLGATLGHNDWLPDALGQLRSHLAILRDPASGFFIHCEENLSGRRSEGAWARGNGWVAMTCAELLASPALKGRERREVESILIELIERLLPLQTRGGLWRTILTDRTSYEETSASAMYLFALEHARRLGLKTLPLDDAIARARRALRRHIDDQGRLLGCSEGTWPGTVEYYKSLGCGEWWWGTGAMLLAESVADDRSPIAGKKKAKQ